MTDLQRGGVVVACWALGAVVGLGLFGREVSLGEVMNWDNGWGGGSMWSLTAALGALIGWLVTYKSPRA